MTDSSAVTIISLPIADRRTSFAYYRDGLGLEAVGELAGDGIPEPLQFELAGGLRIMLVPRGGFEWVIGDHEVAPEGTSECIIGLGLPTATAVDDLVARAVSAGGRLVTEPGQQPWGYTGTFADPDGHLWMITAVAAPGTTSS